MRGEIENIWNIYLTTDHKSPDNSPIEKICDIMSPKCENVGGQHYD